MDTDVQMRWLVNGESMDGGMRAGRVFWTTQARALHYLEHKCAELVVDEVRPQETKPAEPEMTKEDPTKKPSDAAMDGPSTDSAPLSESGKVEQSSASQVAQASTSAPQKSPYSGLVRRRRR